MAKDTNSGYCNSGDYNSGDYNSGYRNNGDYNSGYRNNGDYNSGDYNSGDYNSGNCNSGDYNSGYRNNGDYNSGDYNSGMFNTDEPCMRMFNKETNIKYSDFILSEDYPSFKGFDLCIWVNEEIMTSEEKKEHPSYKTTGGYLKKVEYKDAWAIFWKKTTEENRQKFLNLPNFDADIFEEITGIDVNKEEEKEIEIDGKMFSVSTIKNVLKEYVK